MLPVNIQKATRWLNFAASEVSVEECAFSHRTSQLLFTQQSGDIYAEKNEEINFKEESRFFFLIFIFSKESFLFASYSRVWRTVNIELCSVAK